MSRRFLPISRAPGERAAAVAVFRLMRKAWSPRVAYCHARMRHGPDAAAALAAALYLAAARVPVSGAAPSLDFPGLPLAGLRPDALADLSRRASQF